MKSTMFTWFGWRRSSRKPIEFFLGEINFFLYCLSFACFYFVIKKNLWCFFFYFAVIFIYFSYYFRDFNAAPELMPKTPSQKKNSRRKRVSLGRQEENQTRRRLVV